MKKGLFALGLSLGLLSPALTLAQEKPSAEATIPETGPAPEADPPKPPIEPVEKASKSPAAPTGVLSPSSDAAGAAEAEQGTAEDRGGSEPADEAYGHGMQFGLRAGIVGGYRIVFRYDKSPFCTTPDPEKDDKNQQKFCGHGAPLAADIALSFGIADFAEPYVWGRFGFAGESETNTEPALAIGAGARIYTMSDSKFKIFIEPAVGLELEGGSGNPAWQFETGEEPEYKTDFLFHLAVGPQFDFARAVGIYASAGITTGILRYIHTGLELAGGVQVRAP